MTESVLNRWLVACLLGLAASPATAAVCTVLGTPLAFGTYGSPGGSTADSTSVVSVTCTPTAILLACNTGYTIRLSVGTASSYTPRQLASGANRLNYNLYTTAARTTIWGDGSGGTGQVNGTVSTSLLGLVCFPGTNNHTVYGRIPAAQNAAAGVYADTITVTVTY